MPSQDTLCRPACCRYGFFNVTANQKKPHVKDTVAMPEKKIRLSALRSYGILDTPATPEFDDIVHLACQSCRAPIGVVGFLSSDRHWFKARIGVENSEVPLSDSVCRLAVDSGNDIFEIPNLAENPQTRENPFVSGLPGVRFYASVVLRTPQGTALGTVCVLDTVPRPNGLTPDEVESLRALARLTMILLEMHRALGLGHRMVVRLPK
jgi:GAF domain-containing protein